MPKPSNRLTRGSVVAAIVCLAFAGLAGVGLAQITTSSSPDPFAAAIAADSQNGKPGKKKGKPFQQTTTAPSTSTTTTTASTTTAAADADIAGHKVDVCHNATRNNPHTINIAEAALPAHIAHGDTMGVCAVTTTTNTTSTTSSAKKPKKQKAQKQQKAVKQQAEAKSQKPKKQRSSSKGKSSGKSGGHGKKGGGKGKG